MYNPLVHVFYLVSIVSWMMYS